MDLKSIETHDDIAYTTQAEMSYNRLGQRLSMDAAGVIAYYVMDGNRPLTAESNGNTTSYLYGLGVIGEESNTWSYSLEDGTNTQHQLTDTTIEDLKDSEIFYFNSDKISTCSLAFIPAP